MAASVLITDSKKLADKVQKELEKQLNQLERESIARTAYKIMVTSSLWKISKMVMS